MGEVGYSSPGSIYKLSTSVAAYSVNKISTAQDRQDSSGMEHRAAAEAGIQPWPGSVGQSASGDAAAQPGAGPAGHGYERSRHKAHPCL